MPQLPDWAPPPEHAGQLSAAAAALRGADMHGPSLSLGGDGAVDSAAGPAALGQQHALCAEPNVLGNSSIETYGGSHKDLDLKHTAHHGGRWRPHLDALAAAARHPRGRLELRLVDGVLSALSGTVRCRRRGDPLRLEVLRVLHTVCAGDIDAVADLGLFGFHAQIARYAAAATNAPAQSDTEQADDDLVAEIMSAIVSSGCPFNSSRDSSAECRPAPLQFAACSDVHQGPTLVLRQVPKPVGVHYDVGFLLWPNAILLSRFFCGNIRDGVNVRRALLPNARVLELGAGIGMVGLALARCACFDDEMAQSPAEIILTDFNPEVLQNLRYNISLNCPELQDTESAGRAPIVRAAKLDFTAATTAAAPARASAALASEQQASGWIGEDGEHEAAADVVVGADIIASAEDARNVVGVLQLTLAKPHGVAFLALPHSESRYGVDALNGYLDQVEELRYEIVPYERLVEGGKYEHGRGSGSIADRSARDFFAGLESERASGMRWLHYRIWWRDANAQSSGAGLASPANCAIDPLHRLDESELHTLLAATGWGSDLLANGAGRKQMVAVLRGCMRACSHESVGQNHSTTRSTTEGAETCSTGAEPVVKQPKSQLETAADLPHTSEVSPTSSTVQLVDRLYCSTAADIQMLANHEASEMVRRAKHEMKVQEQVAARKAARLRKLHVNDVPEHEPEPEPHLKSECCMGTSHVVDAVDGAAVAVSADESADFNDDADSGSDSSGEVDALFDNLEDALCDHLGEEYNDKEDVEELYSDQLSTAVDKPQEAAKVEQWLYSDPWQRLHELGFGPYRELLSEYDLIDAEKMRVLGYNKLEQQLRELQLPESDMDRLLAAVFSKKITSATGGIYDQSFLAAVQPLYDMHMGVENMGPLLYSLVRFHKPRHVLEVGAGYTSIFILQALHDNSVELANYRQLQRLGEAKCGEMPWCVGEFLHETNNSPGVLHCVDDMSHDDTTAHLVQDTAAQLGLDAALQLHVGDAWELHRTMDPSIQFDLCWFDFGVGRKVDEFLGHWWPRVRPTGGLVLLHSTLTNSLTRRWLDGMLARITPPVPAPSEEQAGVHEHPAHLAAIHAGACDYELLSLLEPHKQFQNSCTMLRKRAHGQHEPIYSNFP